jgi:hypothetical protein
MILENIMKVADIHEANLPAAFVKWVRMQSPTYRDQSTPKEHLYSLEELTTDIEEGSIDEPTPGVAKTLGEAKAVLDANDCAYLRIIAKV